MKKITIIGMSLLVLMVLGFGVLSAGAGDGVELAQVINLDIKKMIDTGKQIKKAATPWKYSEERTNGRVLAAKVVEHFGLWEDQAWMNYVNIIGRSLAPYSKRPDIKYMFGILDTDDVNAYSCPGGYIFVTRGLLGVVDSEAQLAGVLAHEIGHIGDKDIEKEVRKQAGLGAAYNVGLMVAQNVEGGINSQQARALEQVGGASWDVLISKGLSKEDEYQADKFAALNAAKLGYNPNGIKSFLEKLVPMEKKKGAKLKILLGTHPKPSKRIAQLDKVLAKNGLAGSSLPDHTQRFQDFRNAHPVP